MTDNFWKKEQIQRKSAEAYPILKNGTLMWDDVQLNAEMPILRENYPELAAAFQIYWTEIEIERNRRCLKVFTNM